MKPLILILAISLLVSCRHDKDDFCPGTVTITNSAPGCGGWGIVVQGVKYPSRNIPEAFKQDGLTVCTRYEIYDDMALCACCGGKWANIISMTPR